MVISENIDKAGLKSELICHKHGHTYTALNHFYGQC